MSEQNCKVCLKGLRNKAKVSCIDCQGTFHGKCVNMSAEDIGYLTEEGNVWRCEPCSKTRRKSMVLDTKSQVTYDDIFKLMTELREDFRRVEVNLGASLNSCHEELTETKKIVSQQKEELEAWMATVEALRSENCALRKQVTSLEARLDDAEQYSRRNTLEIQGIPLQRGEDVVALVKDVGRALDYPVDDAMIDACHRVRAREGSGKPPGIVVKMVRRLDAEALLQRRRVKRNLNTHDIGLTSAAAAVVYVNESLSPSRRRLLQAARGIKEEKNYSFLWVRGGKILLRKVAGDKVHVITHMDDLTSL